MSDVNSLSIQIKADASKASRNLDKLTASVKSLSGAMSGTNIKRIDTFANSLSKLASTSKSLNGIKNYANAMASLANATKNINNTKLDNMSDSITRLGSSLSGLDLAKARNFTNAVARLANAGDKTSATANGLPLLQKNLKSFVRALSGANVLPKETNEIVSSISRLANAGAKASTTANALDALGDKTLAYITKISKAPQVNENTVRLVSALGQLANAGAKTNSVFNTLAGGTRRASSSMSGFGNTVRGAFSALIKFNSGALMPTRVNIFKLADTVASLTGKFWILTAITRKVGASIGSAMDYVETLNYFDNSLDTLKSRANEDFKQLGYDTAETYVNSFRERSETLLAKMSGFKINADTGMLEMTNMQNLGVDPNMLMNYQSVFTQMATSLGLATTNASKLGQILPEIGADMASLYNKEFTDVWDDLQSGITGMARTWDKYGTNIRVANMEQYAATHGLDVNVKTMSQADKVLLRTIILLDSQRSAWTDLATTINQPRNQLRMLQANFTNLARAIGSIFLPIVAAVLPYLNAVMIVLNRAANAIANFVSALTGYKPKDLTGSIAVDSGVGDLAEDTDDYSNSAKKAAKATKEWKNQLMGFDEINKLEDSSDSGNGGGGSGSPSGAGGGGLQDAFDSIYDEYQKAWDKAFNSMDNDAQRMAKKIQDAVTKAWETSDGSGIGSAIAEWLNKGINAALGVVDKKTAVFKKFATVIATSINGFVDKLEWKNLGTLIGKNIKGDLEAVETFFDTVNWDNLGKGIATSLNAYFNSDTIEQKLKTIASVFKGAVELAFGAIEEFDFKSIGEHIGTGINDVLKKFGEVDPKTGLTTWQKLGKALSDGVSGLLDALITALDKVDWDKVGTAIGEFLEKVDWNKALLKVVQLIGKTFGALLETYIGSFKKSPVKTAILTAIGAVFTGVKISKTLKAFAKNDVAAKLATYLGEAFKNSTFLSKLKTGVSAFGTALKTTLTADIATTFTSGSCAAIAGTIATGIVGALIAAIGGWKLGKHIYNSLKKDENGDNIIDRFVTWCGDTMQKNAIKFVAGGKVFMANLAIGMLEKIPEWLQKLLGIDGKIADLKAQIRVEQDQTIKDAQTKLDNLSKNRTATVTADAKTDDASKALGKDGLTKKRTAEVDAKAETSDAEKKLGTGKDGLTRDRDAKVTASLTNKKDLSVKVNAKGNIKDKLAAWQKTLNENKLKTVVTLKPDGSKLTLEVHKDPNGGSNSVLQWGTKKKAKGGVLKNGKWHNITQYAAGGIPNQGQMFIAREAGPELVGNLGNATAVMNNDQIVASVAKGVQGAVEAGMRNVANMSSSNNPQYMQADIIIDGRKVMESVLAEARTVSLATNGTNVFMSI